MNRYQRLMQRIEAGERILIDGGTGTEIERRGVPQLENAWNGGGALSHPEVLREVHEDYLQLGAELVISNNFATHWYALADAGETDRFEAYNRRGVELAREARERTGKADALVAAGISSWSWTGNHPALEDLQSAAEKQVAFLADAGAELIILEMMIDIDKMTALLATARATGLPVWVGFTCDAPHDGRVLLRNGEPLVDALAVAAAGGADLVAIMHTEVEYIDACLDEVASHWSGPFGVYAHSGVFEGDRMSFDSTISPEDYCTYARGWLDRGARVIGGCCGIEPRHIKQLAGVVAEYRD